ncbi:hypothetical protein BGZ59_000937 [Podila verticillata]|nr:hypothetical protein BGZ59_000937 [Podila verticillata]
MSRTPKSHWPSITGITATAREVISTASTLTTDLEEAAAIATREDLDILGSASTFLDATENFPLGPEASKLLKISIGTNLTAYFDNSVDSAGSTAALLANTLPQIVDVIKGLQKSLGSALDVADPVFQVLYDFISQPTKASQDLVACTGAKVSCTGLETLSGYAIKIGMPICPSSAIALMLLQPTIDKISDGLIAGNDKGLTDLLKFIVDSRVGVAGALMPALLKAVLDVIKPIMNIIKDYPKTQT